MKSMTCENNMEIILCVSKLPKEISINLLSDADFTEEECEDLRQKVKDGLIQKPTVVELQEKARSLHVDITKHWIARELKMLDQRKGQANEKGWRREFFEYIERKKLLETPAEQSRLLENYPIVIPEVADLEPKNQDTVDELKTNEALPQLIIPINHNRRLEDIKCLEPTTVDQEKEDEALEESMIPRAPNYKSGGNAVSSAEGEEYHAPFINHEREQNVHRTITPISPHYSKSMTKRGVQESSILGEHPQQILLYPNDQHEVTFEVDADRYRSSCFASVNQTQQNADAKQATSKKQEPVAAEVIELDSESDDENQPNAAVERGKLEDPESNVWLISGPDGVQRNRKYSLSLLKRWSVASSYAFKFKVWKEGQSQEQAISLSDAISLAFARP